MRGAGAQSQVGPGGGACGRTNTSVRSDLHSNHTRHTDRHRITLLYDLLGPTLTALMSSEELNGTVAELVGPLFHRALLFRDNMTNISRHLVNHLLTFSLQDGDVQSVEEALARLSFLAQNKKLWSQQMFLDVTSESIVLRDVQSQDELEKYTFKSILRCDSKSERHFPSLLLLVCQSSEQKKPDIHFFSCDTMKAEQICVDISQVLSGPRSSSRSRSIQSGDMSDPLDIPSPPLPHAPNPPPAQPPPYPGPRANGVNGPDYALLRAEREVGILNHCFDDIESFMAKLQQTAEAATVLNQRKKKKKKSKKQSAEEDLLTAKAKPPPEEEFVDIFQKFKYCFSLLARLKSTISNPSSEELVHHVFKPLDMMVRTTGGPTLGAAVSSPALSSSAVTLLQDTLSEEERQLWTSLGPNWTQARALSQRSVTELCLSALSQCSVSALCLSALSQSSVSALCLSVLSQRSVTELCLSALSQRSVTELCLSALSQRSVSVFCLSALSQRSVSALCLSALSQRSVSVFCLSALSQRSVSELCLSALSQRSVSALCLSALSQRSVSALCLSALSQRSVSALCLSVLSQRSVSALCLSALSQRSVSALCLSALSQRSVSALCLSALSQRSVSALCLSALSQRSVSALCLSALSQRSVSAFCLSALSQSSVSALCLSALSQRSVSALCLSVLSQCSVSVFCLSVLSQRSVSVLCLSALPQCSVSVFCLSVLSQCSVSVFYLSVLSQCSVSVFCLSVLSQCSVSVFCLSVLSQRSVSKCTSTQSETWTSHPAPCSPL
uniref:Uncharacterized protein n=1 Tax=Knipowitschia caucasica TaxID=637954 RepID=A0AAV2LFF7_KNICA